MFLVAVSNIKSDIAKILRRNAGLKPREKLNEAHIEKGWAKAAARPDGSFEFGIGLEYGSEIGLTTIFA